jgi:hypothetical protein
MVKRVVLLAFLVGLAGCQAKPRISIQLFPAVLAADPSAPAPAGWMAAPFGGREGVPAGTYHVRPDTLLTEWSIAASKPAGRSGGPMAVAVRLNAYAVRRLAQYGADPANLGKPLALRIDGRWADFSPLLEVPRDRMILHGFTPEEAARLERYLSQR